MKRTFQFISLFAVMLLTAAACNNEPKDYLVRETDSINFSSALASSKQITLRCQGAWQTVIPEGCEWIYTVPSEGVGDGSFEWITVYATQNRSVAREGTIYLENGGELYPITVTQPDGSIIYGSPYVDANLIEQEESKARVCFTYTNAYGDETIDVTCTLDGDYDGLSVASKTVDLVNGGDTIALEIEGTPTTPGYVTFTVIIDGTQTGSVRARVYSLDEMPIEGLPVFWEFCTEKGSTEDVNNLTAKQPNWIDEPHYLVSEDGGSKITIVEADGKTATAINGWGCNDGHAYIKGLYLDDYWLMTIPVKYLTEGTKLNCTGTIGGSGSSAGFFLLEYSADGETWYQADGAKTETYNNTEVTYHAQAFDSYLATEEYGLFSYTFPISVNIPSGYLYIRYRVSADVRVTMNNTITTGGGGSTRLKGEFGVSVVDDNL